MATFVNSECKEDIDDDESAGNLEWDEFIASSDSESDDENTPLSDESDDHEDWSSDN